MISRYNTKYFSQTQEFKDLYKDKEFKDRVVAKIWDTKQKNGYFNKSKGEDEVYDFLLTFIDSSFIKRHDHTVIPPFELDIYIPNYNLAIEFNGIYWHSENGPNKVDKYYHFNKSILCQQAGIRLIQIYDYEWYDNRLKQILKSIIQKALHNYKITINSNQCVIKNVSKEELIKFNDVNNLYLNLEYDMTLGLFYNNQLVQQISFIQLNSTNEWKIVSNCSLNNYYINEGTNKLLEFFIINYSPASIICNFSFDKFSGSDYESLGMIFNGFSDPNRININNHILYDSGNKVYQLII